MDRIEEAVETAVRLLRSSGGRATNSRLLRELDGDSALFAEVRETLILEDIAVDKDGVGLVLREAPSSPEETGPASGDERERGFSVFLSYGRADASELAARLRRDLEQRGFFVWKDTRELKAGHAWEQEIQTAIRATDVLLAVLSPHATRTSPGGDHALSDDSVCLDELSYARHRRPRTPIVPLMALPCEPPLCIFRLNYLDATTWLESPDAYARGIVDLTDALHRAVAGETHYRQEATQLDPLDFGWFLDRKRENFTGRDWAFEAIERLASTPGRRGVYVTGSAGAGKSAIVAELIHRNVHGRVLAVHCFRAGMPVTMDPARLVRSLAAMIAARVPAYAELLQDEQVSDLLAVSACRLDPVLAFAFGIARPLRSVGPPGEVRYLVLDGLDELGSQPGYGAGRQTVWDTLQAIAEYTPHWVRLLATSRPLERPPAWIQSLERLNLDARRDEDVESFLERMLPSEGAQPQVTRPRAGGMSFLQATQFVDMSARRPDLVANRLRSGASDESAQFAIDLSSRLDRAPVPGHLLRILLVLTVAKEELTAGQLARLCEVDEAAVDIAIERLSGLVREEEFGWTLFHESFRSWLSRSAYRVGSHSFHPPEASRMVAESCMRRRGENWSPYAQTYLASHLADAGALEEFAPFAIDLDFLRSRVESGDVYALLDDLDRYVEHIGRDLRVRWIRDAIQLHSDALEAHPELLFQCAWNACWWFDAEASRSFEVTPRVEAAFEDAAGLRDVASASDLVDAWRSSRPSSLPSRWYRAVRPPPATVGSGLFRSYRGHRDAVVAVVLLEGGRILASQAEGGAIKLWNIASGIQLSITEFPALESRAQEALRQSIERSKPEHRLFGGKLAQSERHVLERVEPVWDSPVRVRSKVTGEDVLLASTIGSHVTFGELSPNGAYAAAAVFDDWSVRVWACDSGCQIAHYYVADRQCRALAFSPNSDLLFAAIDTEVLAWRTGAVHRQRMFRPAHGVAISSVAVSPEGDRIASSSCDSTIATGGGSERDDSVRLWNGVDGTLQLSVEIEDVQRLAFSNDGRWLALGLLGEVAVLDVLTGDVVFRLELSRMMADAIAWSADDQALAASFRSGDVHIVSVQHRMALASFEEFDSEVTWLSFTTDGAELVAGSVAQPRHRHVPLPTGPSTDVVVWNIRDQSVEQRLRGDDAIERLRSSLVSPPPTRARSVFESEILGYQTGEVVGRLPAALIHLATSRDSRVVAGSIGRHLHMYRLESSE